MMDQVTKFTKGQVPANQLPTPSSATYASALQGVTGIAGVNLVNTPRRTRCDSISGAIAGSFGGAAVKRKHDTTSITPGTPQLGSDALMAVNGTSTLVVTIVVKESM